MYKNINHTALGVSGRQSELIELALTFGFRSMDFDVIDLHKRAQSQSLDMALRFITSAKVRIGDFALPISVTGDDGAFAAQLTELKSICETAQAGSASRCYYALPPASDELPYHENFELHRSRVGQIGDVLGEYEIRLGLGIQAAPAHRREAAFQFVHQAEDLLAFIKAVGNSNVGLFLDTWNWRVGGGSVEQLRELSGDQVVSVRFADISPEVDLGAIDDTQRCLPSEDDVANNEAIAAWLVEAEFEGSITIYPSPGQFSGLTRDRIVEQTSNMLERCLQSAGFVKPKPETEEAEPAEGAATEAATDATESATDAAPAATEA
ncbi:MAG: sugar phosphate isomerase/epimerase [Pirellulaceae bacterium]|jgi:sugar phosphate isomerase/epimerase|nr:sugar phosphate isomerase/epimerase [Pirellulaceae bacterium]